MKPLTNTDLIKTPLILKITAFTLISITFFYLGKHWSNGGYQQLLFFSTPQNSISISPNNDRSFNITPIVSLNQSDQPLTDQATTVSPPPDESPLPDPNQTFGIIDSDGKMSDDFEAGEFDPDIVENWGNGSEIESGSKDSRFRAERYELCPLSMREYIPCLDNVKAIKRLKSTEKGERFERHCPEKGDELNCLVPPPKGYRPPIPWPRSRDEVLESNWGLFCHRENGKKKSIFFPFCFDVLQFSLLTVYRLRDRSFVFAKTVKQNERAWEVVDQIS
jgi:hypothetical protein